MANSVAVSRCPYCLETKPGLTPATPSLSGDAQEDILDAEIKRVEKLISNLFFERSRLYKQRNEMRSPIYSLPQEILTLIFKFACPPVDFLEMYLYHEGSFASPTIPHPRIMGVLAAVSGRWHDVVSSTPSLWASFVADDCDINAMQAILARSSNLPVIASLRFPVYTQLRKPHAAILAPILQKYASRVRMLHVYRASPTWLQENIPSFDNLELLCLKSAHVRGDESIVIDGAFTSLILKNTPRGISFPWSQIEVLHLGGRMLVDEGLELLTKGTHLREYRIQDFNASRSDGRQLPSSPFILPCLELFEWTVGEGDSVDRAMMQHIRMPILRTLVWDNCGKKLNPSSFLSTFFENIPSTLSAVELRGCSVHSNFSIFSYILHIPNLEHLTFKDCSVLFMDRAFSDLGSETCLVVNQVVPVLPKLKTIYVGRFHGSLNPANILKTFQHIRSRPLESSQGSPFRLEFSEHKVDWTPEFKEELIRMVEEGYQVELWEDLKPVDWLPRVNLPRP